MSELLYWVKVSGVFIGSCIEKRIVQFC